MLWSDNHQPDRTTAQQRRSAGSKRLPLLLVATLLLAIIAVSGFAVALLQGQRAVLEETVRKSERESVILLAHRTEQTVLNAIRAPFRLLKNVPIDDGDLSERLNRMQQQFPQVERVLFLDSNLKPMHTGLAFEKSKQEASMHVWLLERLRMEHSENSFLPYRIHSLVETINGRPTLLVWQPIDDANEQKGWLAIGFDIGHIQRERIGPLLNHFRQTHVGRIRLQDPESTWDEGALNWPVGRILPGWQLVFESDPLVTKERLRQTRLVTLGIASAVLFAMLLSTFVVWREIHRERVLLELRNRFIANVSHELKSPLTLIRMYTETLYLGRLNDEHRRQQYYRTILRESERLTHMIDNILDFARSRKGMPTYHLTEVDIGHTVAQVLNDYRPRINEKGLRLSVQLQPDLPPVLHDPHGVTQILVNLVDNAVKYAASGKRVMVNLERNNNHVLLRVKDWGPGIAMQAPKRPRENQRKGNPNRPDLQGLGLGLALVRQIADAHRATFTLTSAPDHRGTEATVSFSIEDAVG